MRNSGGDYFGPRLRKPSIKKGRTKLMRKSLDQLKKTQECYKSMSIRYNNDNKQWDDDEVVSKRDRRNKAVPQKTQQNHLKGPSHDGPPNLACAIKGISGFTKSMECSIQPKNQNANLAEDGRIIGGKVVKRTDPSLEEKPGTHEDNDSEKTENCKPTKRRRRLILNEYEDDDDVDQILAGAEIGTAGLTTETVVVKDCPIEVSNPFLLESLKLQYYGCSLPIDDPVWSGTIKISGNKNVSLAAHLSSKCYEKVWKLARSLQPKIVATKLSRLEAWPKSFESSSPTDNDIALYFLPCKMRQDAYLDQLVKEVVENDMALQAVIGEADMLIFPSILLPKQHQTFQGKPYLWAVFKGRKNKVSTVEAQAQHHCKGLEAPEEAERQDMEHQKNPSLALAKAPSPATKAPTMDAAMSANHGQIHSSLAVPTGALFGFVAQRTPRIEQIIKEMEREGAVVVTMQGDMIGSVLGQARDATAARREEDEMPPSSSGRVAMV